MRRVTERTDARSFENAEFIPLTISRILAEAFRSSHCYWRLFNLSEWRTWFVGMMNFPLITSTCDAAASNITDDAVHKASCRESADLTLSQPSATSSSTDVYHASSSESQHFFLITPSTCASCASVTLNSNDSSTFIQSMLIFPLPIWTCTSDSSSHG